MSELKITRDEWLLEEVISEKYNQPIIRFNTIGSEGFIQVYSGCDNTGDQEYEEAFANAMLIRDAARVYKKTGKTPSELVDSKLQIIPRSDILNVDTAINFLSKQIEIGYTESQKELVLRLADLIRKNRI